jgi:hypothetical protein
VAVQPAHQFGHERRASSAGPSAPCRPRPGSALGIALGHLEHAVRPLGPRDLRSARLAATCTATRRRFSISASRSMIGKAHSSPSSSGCTDW